MPNNAIHRTTTRIREKRVSMPGHIDIQLFQRIRQRTNCKHSWKTAEVDHSLLEELVTLRTAIDTILPKPEQLKDALNKWIEGTEEISGLITALGAASFLARDKRELSKKHQAAIHDVIKQRQQKPSAK